ncbi:MAG: diguanylate cyclase [Bdellovibrionia bacterium]
MSPETDTSRYSQRARYLDLFNRMNDLVFLIAPETLRILDVNPAVELRMGLTLQDLSGRALVDWVPEDVRADFEKHLRIAKRSYAPKKFRTRWKLKDSTLLTLEVVACWLRVGNVEEDAVMQIIGRDVTQEVEAQEQAQRYMAELQALNKKLEELSTMDEMTKLSNFRQFKSQLQVEHDRCFRNREPYAIVFCDVDNFKHYNDRNGHPAGDALLRELARVIQSEARKSDLPARYGGEEFAVLCRATDLDGAMIFAERLRARIAEHEFPHGKDQPLGRISVSIGVAVFPDHGETPEAVLEAADQALYHSKKNGRNRVTPATKFQS